MSAGLRQYRFIVAVVTVLAMRVQATAQDRLPIPLPTDPSVAVVTLDSRSNASYFPRKILAPWLTIRADGSVTIVDVTGLVANIEAKLSSAELQELLLFVIQEQDFFGFDNAEVANAMIAAEARGGSIYISHGADWIVRIQTADRSRETVLPSPGSVYAAFKDLKPLGQFMEIQKRLTRLIAEIEAGGKEGIEKALTLANRYLAQQQPNIQPLTAQHFSGAKVLDNGNSSVSFARERDDCMVDLFAVEYRSDREPEVRAVTTRRGGFSGLLKNLDSRTCN